MYRRPEGTVNKTARKVLPIICQLSVMKQLFKNLSLICASAVATGGNIGCMQRVFSERSSSAESTSLQVNMSLLCDVVKECRESVISKIHIEDLYNWFVSNLLTEAISDFLRELYSLPASVDRGAIFQANVTLVMILIE